MAHPVTGAPCRKCGGRYVFHEPSCPQFTRSTYVVLEDHEWCHACGHPPGYHDLECYQQMIEFNVVKDGYTFCHLCGYMARYHHEKCPQNPKNPLRLATDLQGWCRTCGRLPGKHHRRCRPTFFADHPEFRTLSEPVFDSGVAARRDRRCRFRAPAALYMRPETQAPSEMSADLLRRPSGTSGDGDAERSGGATSVGSATGDP